MMNPDNIEIIEKIEEIEDNSEEAIMQHIRALASKVTALCESLNIPVDSDTRRCLIMAVVYRHRSTSTLLNFGSALWMAHDIRRENICMCADNDVLEARYLIQSRAGFGAKFDFANEIAHEVQIIIVNSTSFKTKVRLVEYGGIKKIHVFGADDFLVSTKVQRVMSVKQEGIKFNGKEYGLMIVANTILGNKIYVLIINEKNVGFDVKHLKM